MTPMEILSRIRCVKTVYLPDWAQYIHLVANKLREGSIPPVISGAMTIPKFLEGWSDMQACSGAGEWCVSVYATSHEKANSIRRRWKTDQHPRYMTLRSRPGRQVKLLGSWDNLRMTWLRFEPAPACVPAPL